MFQELGHVGHIEHLAPRPILLFVIFAKSERAVCAEQIEAHAAAERAAKELEAKSRGEAPWADLAAGGASLHTPRSD